MGNAYVAVPCCSRISALLPPALSPCGGNVSRAGSATMKGSPVGIPTYGVSGIFSDADGDGAHGLNEKKRVSSVYRGRDFAYDIVKILLSEP
jgi:hypothetical protein